jgi:hypothetical protein
MLFQDRSKVTFNSGSSSWEKGEICNSRAKLSKLLQYKNITSIHGYPRIAFLSCYTITFLGNRPILSAIKLTFVYLHIEVLR